MSHWKDIEELSSFESVQVYMEYSMGKKYSIRKPHEQEIIKFRWIHFFNDEPQISLNIQGDDKCEFHFIWKCLKIKMN